MSVNQGLSLVGARRRRRGVEECWRTVLLLPVVMAGLVAAQPADTEPDPAGEAARALAEEESLARFQQVLERRPFHGPAFTGIVKRYAERGELQDLVAEYEKKVEALPDYVEIQIVLARLYLRIGRSEASAAVVDSLGELPEALARDDRKLLVLKSEIYQRSGRLDAARVMLTDALAQAPTVSERTKLAEALADLHLRSRKRDEAAAVLIELAEEFPDNYLHRKRIADALARRDLHAPAAEQYRAILPLVEAQTDKRCEVLRQLGRSMESLERRQEAIEVYTEAINLLAGGHWLQRELHERIVSLYRASHRLDDLIAYCRLQIERAPEQTAMRTMLADVLAANGQADEARQTLTEAVELFPADLVLSERRIELLDRLDDGEGIADEYERIIGRHPDDLELYIAYGQFLANNRELGAARNQWKHVLNSDLTDATLAHRLGTLFEVYELLDDAVECYERALTLSPRRTESYATLSRLWFFRGDREQALSTLHRLADANPDDAPTHAALCQAMLNLGLTDEALTSIGRAAELDDDNFRYRLTHSNLLVRAGRLDEALEVRRGAIDLIDNAGQRSQAISVLVSMHDSANRLTRLEEAEQQRLDADPDNVVSLMLLARAADFDQDFASARRWLERLLETQPSHEEARRQLARLHEAVGDVDAAIAVYRRLIELHPARGRRYYQAIADAKLGYADTTGAVETFEQMVQTAPGNATVLKSVAEQLVRLGELERALEYYEQSLGLQPDRHEVRLEYGRALEEAGRLEEALDEFKAAALQQSDRDTAREALTRLHETASQLGLVETLLEELQARVETNPDATLVARALAELLIREFDYPRALELLDLILRHNPRDAGLGLTRAELLRRLVRFDEALDTYRRLLRLPGLDRDYVLGEMGKACFEAGRVDQARQVWRQINHKLYAGSLLQNNGLLDDAIDVYREGIRLNPAENALHRNLIRTLDAAGRSDEALSAARRLLDLEPDNVFNIRELALAYLERGDRAAATEIAARLFSAAVIDKERNRSSSRSRSWQAPVWAMSLQSSWGWGGRRQGAARSNLDAAIKFYQDNNLHADLQDIITAQLEAQPDNAVLKQAAVELFSTQFGEPQRAVDLLKELETAAFPLEYQRWLGQCSQRDYMRVQQYQLIAGKPALRDARLAELDPKAGEDLNRDEMIELAVIRRAQGVSDAAVALLDRAAEADPSDVVVLSALVDQLMRVERFADAEPHAITLSDLLADQRDQMQAAMVERVRRDFVRTLPIPFQLRVNDDLLRDIAHKWTLGHGFASDYTGNIQTMGYFQTRLALATIYAKTDRMERARVIWQELIPRSDADADGWTMLASVAQLHDQHDLAFDFYEQALAAAKVLATDPLLQRIYGGSSTQVWFGSAAETFDASFNKIVETFAGEEKLIELYDFLRETDQVVKAKRVAEQYELIDELKRLYEERLEGARKDFHSSKDDTLRRSVPYLVHACKIAELHDQTGNWAAAQAIYEAYLDDFPDELGLLTTLGEVAEAQHEYATALEWEKRVLAAKERLVRRARAWMMRQIPMTPGIPSVLDRQDNRNSWMQRWGRNRYWSYRGSRSPLARWPTWMRIARLHLASDNVIGAGQAMERAIGAAGNDRERAATEVLDLIQQRQLADDMLSVLRTLAVHRPTDERVQLAFAEALTSHERDEVAAEVYRRMLRRGVSNIDTLAQVRRQLAAIEPDTADAASDTLAVLESEVAADDEDLGARMRLAKAYFYSLRIDDALEVLLELQEDAPHLEEVLELVIEIYTIRDDREPLIAALKDRIHRLSDRNERRPLQTRLVEILFADDRAAEALEALKELADPRDPQSYQRVGVLLHYFGLHDEAVAQFKLGTRSQARTPYPRTRGGDAETKALILMGDIEGAAAKLLEAIDAQAKQMMQFGAASMYSMYNYQQNQFNGYMSLFVVEPALADELQRLIEARRAANPNDPNAAKLLMELHQRLGRDDLADAILQELAGEGATDQALVTALISQAVERKNFEAAIRLAEGFISQQPKPKLPPGMPPQYAGMMMLMSARNVMLCTLGDIYWEIGDADKAFECYGRIVDENVDETKLAYAAICLVRDRLDEARSLIDEALDAQHIKSPSLLQFSAVIAGLEDRPDRMFDDLALAAELGAGQAANPFGGGGRQGSAAAPLAALAARAGMIGRFSEFMEGRIEKNPNQWDHYQLWSKTLYDAGRIDEAFEVIDRAAAIKSLQARALGQKLRWLDGFAEADELIPLHEEVLDLTERQTGQQSTASQSRRRMVGQSQQSTAGQSEQLRSRLGDLLWAQGRTDEAIEVWMRRQNLKSASTHTGLAGRMLAKDEWKRAEQSYREALELDPDNASAHHALARLAYHDQDYDRALEHLVETFRLKRRNTTPTAQPRYLPNYQNQPNVNRADDEELTIWAMDLARDPSLAAQLADGTDDESAERRLALAVLTGDWPAVEAELRRRLDYRPYDPLAWTLWAETCERLGDWETAAEAWEFVRRLRKTSLPRHREELKLVLAGRQVREAVGGSRRARTPLSAQPNVIRQTQAMMYGFPGRFGQGNVDSETARLAALYIFLGDFKKAEHLYLLANEGSAQTAIPQVAALMWQQGARDRALELMRLIAIVSGDAGILPTYAGMLSEAGEVEAATDMLIRAYRGQALQTRMSYGMAAFWYSGRSQSFEQGQESSISSTLYDVLKRNDKLDDVMAELRHRVEQNPGDTRLAKLVVGLLIRDRQWTEVRDALAAWVEARPESLAARLELLHAHLQLEEWAEALALVEKFREDVPTVEGRWRLYKAFIHLMQDDPDAAVAAVAPLVDDPRAQDSSAVASQIWTVLAAAGDHQGLRRHLEALAGQGVLDEAGAELLIRVHQAGGRYPQAAQVALDRLWRSPEPVVETSRWYRALVAVVRGAQARNAGTDWTLDRREDSALVVLIADGPDAATRDFEQIVAERPDNATARRGLVFAASQGGHDARAAEANAEFIEWLAARRPQVWRQRQGQPISELAGAALDQMKAQGVRTSQMLAFATQSSGMVQQLLSMSDNPDNQSVTYDTLWRLHHRLQRELLLRARDREGYEALLRLQAELAAVPQSTSANQRIQRYYMPGPFRTSYMPQMQQQPEQVFSTDWQATLSSGLARTGEFTELAEHIEARGSRAPSGDWLRLSEALAAIGRVEDAAGWSQRLAQLRLASLQASDSPQLAAEGGRNQWRWWWYGQTNSQSVNLIRGALDARVVPSPDDEPSVLSSPPADDLWELALLDPDVESRFVGLAGAVGPGWGASATVDQLVSYHEAGDRHEAIIELLERALDFDELMESPRLENYVRACYAANDYERIERVLAASADRSATLAGRVRIGRLMVLRHQGRDADADRLERELLADCRVESANPHPIGPALRQLEQAPGTAVWRSYNRRSSQAYGSWARAFDDDVPTAAAVARQLGLKYTAKLTPGDLTISRIRQAYDRHGFAGHAARLVELELTGPSAARGPIERAGLLLTRANLLHHAGEAEAARAAALEAEELLMSQVDAFPADAEPHRQLARLYAAEAYGPDHEKRLEAVAAASRLDPAFDPSGRQAATCLYELGRFEDAWSAYQVVLHHGEPGYTDVVVLYRGGLAAQHCGHPDEARRLLRQALWRDPLHDLAPQAREVIHDE